MTQAEPVERWAWSLPRLDPPPDRVWRDRRPDRDWIREPIPLQLERAVMIVVRVSVHFPQPKIADHRACLHYGIDDRVGDSEWDFAAWSTIPGSSWGATDGAGTLRVAAPLGDSARLSLRVSCDDDKGFACIFGSSHDHSSLVVTRLRADVLVRNL